MEREYSGEPLKIAIIDDHPLTRFALRAIVEARPDWVVIYECDSPSAFLAQLAKQVPEVAIVDLCFADESGLDLLGRLKKSHPAMRILVYSGNSELQYANRCFRLGASGYVSKEEPSANVREAIECVARGFAYVSDRLTQSVINDAALGA